MVLSGNFLYGVIPSPYPRYGHFCIHLYFGYVSGYSKVFYTSADLCPHVYVPCSPSIWSLHCCFTGHFKEIDQLIKFQKWLASCSLLLSFEYKKRHLNQCLLVSLSLLAHSEFFCSKLFLRDLSRNELVGLVPHILGNLSYTGKLLASSTKFFFPKAITWLVFAITLVFGVVKVTNQKSIVHK